MLVFQVEKKFCCLKTTSILLTWKDPTTKWVPRCILLVFTGFIKSLMFNVIFLLGYTSKDKFELFTASIMIWVKHLFICFLGHKN